MNTELRVGNDKQHGYAARLAKQAGYASLSEACVKALERPADLLVADGISVAEASKVIARLQSDADARPRPFKATYLTPRQLRRIASGECAPPAELDEDATWILDRLAKAHAIAGLFGAADAIQRRQAPVNGDGPIEMQQLLTHYGSWDAIAEAFAVTVSTAKAWGAHLPAARAYEAEIKTDGYVRAPRPSHG